MDRIFGLAEGLRAKGEAFAIATVVRTVAVTAAKAGAKAVIGSDGSISAGWIGGGCARGAVLRAARLALADGQPRLVRIAPDDAVATAEEGVVVAKNHCPSQGSMDVFVEPVLPLPLLLVFGGSPVAVAVAELAPQFGFAVTVRARAAERGAFGDDCAFIEGYEGGGGAGGFAVVATQGSGDEAALTAALLLDRAHVAFVGSHRKAAALRKTLAASGVNAERLARLRAPAGLDIGAVTPEEIALSIVAELVKVRRVRQAGRGAVG